MLSLPLSAFVTEFSLAVMVLFFCECRVFHSEEVYEGQVLLEDQDRALAYLFATRRTPAMESWAALNISQDCTELSAIVYWLPRSNGFSWFLRVIDDQELPEVKEVGLRDFVSRMREEGWVLKKTRSDLDFSQSAAIRLWFKR